MKSSLLGALAAIGVALVPLAAGAQQVNVNLRVSVAPPAPQYEVRPAAPAPSYVWIPGYWTYNSGHYVWAGGHYAQPPEPDDTWVAPRWSHRGRFWVFIAGHWDDGDDDAPRTPVVVVPRVPVSPVQIIAPVLPLVVTQ